MNNQLQSKSPTRIFRWVTVIMILTLCGFNSMAQVSNLVNPTYGYTFVNSSGTYTPLSGGTVFQSGTTLNTDGVSGSISLPFAFTFNGIKENNIFISNNGFITFGSVTAVGNYVPLSTTTVSGYDGAIAGSAMNCVASTASGATPEIRYGSNGGGDYVVQFQDIGQSGFAAIRLTYQIVLKADGKTVQIVYGPNNVGVASAGQCQVGLRGTNDEDWNNRTLSSGGNWNTAGGAAGALNTSAMTLTASSTLPASGLTFTWNPNAYVPTYLANAGGVVQEFTTWTNGPGPGNIPTTNFATNGYGNASWQIDNVTATTTTSGWTGTGGAYTPADYVNASGGHSARFHAQLSNSPQVGFLDYYVNLSAVVGTPTLDFYHINTSGTDILQIFLSSDGGASFAQIGANIGVSASWTAKSISLGGANSATTIIRFKATSDFGSTDIGIDHMLVTPPPVLPTISSFTPNTNLCSSGGQTVTISGTGFTGTTSVTFNLVNATSYVVVNNSTITAVTPASLTPGTIVVTNSVGPTTSGSYTVVAAPTVTVSPTSASICSPGGTPVTLTAGGAVSYSWNPTSGLTPTSGSPVSADPNSTTTYTVTGTDANGCTNTASSIITVSPFPAAVVITPTSPTVCSGTTQMLTSTGGPGNSGTSSTIGSGTAFTTATGEQTAFCNRRVNYVGQTIYTAADLIAAGVTPGANITSMAYNISTNGDATTNANFTVKIGHVGSTTAFPSTAFFVNGSYTTVYGPATYTHAAPGWQTITFSTAFAWDGTSNICVDVRHNGADNINNAQTQFTTTGVNASIYGFNTPATGTLSTSRLNIQLGYLKPATTVVWSPTTNLYTNAGATVPYTGTPSTNVVYFNGTSTTSYSVTSTSAAGCTSTGGVTVTVTPLSCQIATVSSPTCAGANFTVTANVTGGGAPYNYVWSDGVGGVYPNAASITANLPAGSYNFTCAVSDACGGSCNSNVTVTVNGLPNVTVSPSSGLICNPGGSAVTLTAGGASTYAWSPTSGLTPTTGSPVSANPTSTTTYTVSGTDGNGCTSTASALITVSSAVTGATATATPGTLCEGSTLNLTSSASVADAYTMNGNSGVSFIDISGTGISVGTLGDDSEHNITIPSFTFNGTAYTTARVGNNGAIVFNSTSGEVTHLNAALPSTANTAGNIALMPYWDDLDVQLGAMCRTQTVGNLFIIQYTNSTHDAYITGAITFQVQLDLTSGQIHFVYSDVIFGDALYDSGINATIGIQYSGTAATQYSHLTASLVNGQSISFTPPSFNYLWSGPNSFTSGVQNPSIASATPSASGVYSVTITSNSGCTASASTVSVTVNPLPTPTITGSLSFCAGGSTTLDAGSYSSYSWSTGATTQTISVNTAGTFTVTVTDGNGCTGTSPSVTTTINPLPTPTITGTLSFCAGGSTTLDAGSYSSYSWSTGATTQTISVNTAGTFTVTVTDGNGCTGTSPSVSTTVNPLPTPTITGSLSFCEGGSTTLDAGSYSSYSWSTGATTQTISVNTAGTFTVNVTDGNGCTGTSPSVTTTVNPLPTPTISGSLSFCAGGSTTLDAGIYSSYSWSTGATTQTISVNTAGTFTVTVTNGNGCTGTSPSVTTTVNPLPTPTITGPLSFCAGSSTTLDAGSYSSYSWSTGATTQTISVNTAGTFTVTVTDGNGCTGTSPFVSTTVNPLPTPTITGPLSFCAGSSTTLDAGSYSSYSWSTGATTQTISVNTAGTFTVTVTDGNGCTGTSPSVTTSISPSPTAAISGDANICFGGSTNLTINFTGTSPWLYAINGGTPVSTSNNPEIVSVSPASTTVYTVTSVSDPNCTGTTSGSATVTVSNAPPASSCTITTSPVDACVGSTVVVSTNVVPGATSYTWSAPAGTLINGMPSPYTSTGNTVNITLGNVPTNSSGWLICAFASNACGSTNTNCKPIRGTLSTPSPILGSVIACPSTGPSNYTTTSVSGASSYLWTITGDASVSGTGLTGAVTFGPTFTTGSLCVRALLPCGYQGATRCLTIANGTPNLGAMTGTFTVCPGTNGVAYSVPPSAGATTYNWTLPSGASIATGAGTNSITVNFGPTYTNGNVCVIATSVCGINSLPRCKTVASITPGTPGNFTIGATTGVCGQTITYNVNTVAGATGYTWTAPAGASLASANGTNTIDIAFGPGYTTGNVCVTADNSCGSGTPRCVIVKGNPSNPGVVTGLNSVCANDAGIGYSIAPVFGSTGYLWTVPSGASIVSGQGTTSIIVDWGTNGGTIGVTASGTCGNSGTRTLAVAMTCRVSSSTLAGASVNAYPNPVSTKLTIELNAINAGNYTVELMDLAGRVIYSDVMTASEGINNAVIDVATYAKGVYTMRVKNSNGFAQQIRVVVE